MGLDIISVVTEAEEAASKLKSEAASAAAALIENAKTNGKNSIDEAKKKALTESAAYSKEQDEKADSDIIAIEKETKEKVAALTASASNRIDAAAALIKERIVKG